MTIEITSTCIKLNVVPLFFGYKRAGRTTIYHNNVSDRIKEKSDNKILLENLNANSSSLYTFSLRST